MSVVLKRRKSASLEKTTDQPKVSEIFKHNVVGVDSILVADCFLSCLGPFVFLLKLELHGFLIF